MTKILIVANIVVFLLLSFGGVTENGMYLLEHGAAYAPYIVEYKEYDRLFTSMFLHFNMAHLMNNMVTLGVVGTNVEPILGKVRLAIIYLFSGLCGNILSLVFEYGTGNFAISAGASGAVFGLSGSLLALIILNKGRIGSVTKRGMMFMIGISLYLGFVGEGVDNLAHIGGVLGGFVITLLIAPRKKLQREEEIPQM